MMPVVLAALREGIAIGVVRAGIEQAGVASIARHAVALEVGDMPGERRRAKLRALMPDHTGLDDDAPGIGRSAGAQPRNAASTMAPRALATRRPAATVSRLGRCPANLFREALDLASRALARIAAPSRSEEHTSELQS